MLQITKPPEPMTPITQAIIGEWISLQSDSASASGGGMSNIKLFGINQIPEPSVIALFEIGFAGLAFVKRK